MNNKENMKNMVVLKDLPSNIVEEAIVILKPNIKLKSLDLAENKKSNKNYKKNEELNSKKYIVNEAEMVISSYLSKIERKKKVEFAINKKMETKYKRAKMVSFFLGIVLIISLILR